MTMIPLRRDSPLDATYARFTQVVTRLAGRDPADDLEAFGEFLLVRDRLFEQLGLPVTAHNSLGLYDVAEAKLPLAVLLADADHFFPRAIVDDEALMLSALATYFRWREVQDLDARVYDVEGFLGVPHHPHNTAVITAWLDGAVGYVTARAALLKDERRLDDAVC